MAIVTIPAQQVYVDLEAWAETYGVSVEEAPADIEGYFEGLIQEQIDQLGLNEEYCCPEKYR